MAHREVAVREDDVQALARRLAGLNRGRPAAHLRRRLDVNEVLMRWAVARPAFKVPLFRFIDALPACRTDAEVLAHLDGYLDGPPSAWPPSTAPWTGRRAPPSSGPACMSPTPCPAAPTWPVPLPTPACAGW